MNLLRKVIEETGANHATKKLTVLRQLNTMMYAYLTHKESLRDIADTIATDKKLQEHTGTISSSHLSRRNNQCDSEIFEIIFKAVIEKLFKIHQTSSIPRCWGILKILDPTG